MKHYYAVVDTNVIVSALIAKKPESPPRQVFWAMLSGKNSAGDTEISNTGDDDFFGFTDLYGIDFVQMCEEDR